MDVPCAIDVVLGTSTLTVEECGSLALNAVLRLKQPAGTDLEVRVSGLPFAAGELVVADDAVSLRVGRILPPAPERLS